MSPTFFDRVAMLALLVIAIAPCAQAQDFAGKLIRVVVPVPAGGSSDLAARTVAQELQSRLGANIVVENRPGGGGQVGVESVINAPPDGLTLLVSPNGYLTIMGGFRPGFPDPRHALVPITKLVNNPFAIAVNASSPVKNFDEFLAFARSRPDGLNFATPAVGTHVHLVGEMLRLATGINLVAIPFKGTAAATTALLSGDVDVTISDMATLLPLANAGKLRLIAATDPKRSTLAPDLPTVAESGIAGFGASAWLAMLAPGKTPPAVVVRLNDEVTTILNQPGVRKTFLQSGMDPAPTTSAEMAEIMNVDTEKWAALVKTAGIKFN
jgi:tripartite-type tricarboxylate transporter receptor subunit TctC